MAKLFLWFWIFIQPLIIAIGTGFIVGLIIHFAIPPEGGDPGGFSPPDNIYEVLILLGVGVFSGFVAGVFLSNQIYQKHLSSKKSEDESL